jgi:hypothetical protein
MRNEQALKQEKELPKIDAFSTKEDGTLNSKWKKGHIAFNTSTNKQGRIICHSLGNDKTTPRFSVITKDGGRSCWDVKTCTTETPVAWERKYGFPVSEVFKEVKKSKKEDPFEKWWNGLLASKELFRKAFNV